MENKINKFLKVYPWYYSLSCWLLFFDILNTIYLTTVKKLSASEFSLLYAISLIVSIILLIPLLKVVKKIGNTKSLRIGNFIFVIGAILLTFSNNFIGLLSGKILYEISFVFKSMILVELRKNLLYLKKEDEFIKYANKATMTYAIIILISSLIAGYIFNINQYLPMYLSILWSIISFILSFYMFDVTEQDKNFKIFEEKKFKTKKIKPLIFIIMLITYGLETGIIDIGQSQAKLFTQNKLELNLSIENTALILSLIVSISQIFSIISNYSFPKIYQKLKEKSGYLLGGLLVTSFSLLLIGNNINLSFIIQIIIISLGFTIISIVKGPYSVFLEDLFFKTCNEGSEQDLAAYLMLSRNISGALISGLSALILIYQTLDYVILVILLMSIIQLYCFHGIKKLTQ